MKKGLIVAIILALVVMLIPGCAGISPPLEEDIAVTEEEGEEGTGPLVVEEVNFRLWISDEVNAIDDFDELWVTISDVGMVQADGNGLIKEPIAPPAEVDLTKLEGDNATQLWSGNLLLGEYTKVFLYVTTVAGILKNGDGNGEPADVKLPSSKLQISKPFTISSGQVVDFVFDITVIEAGKSGKYNLLPQIAQSGPDQDINDVDLKITATTLPDGEVGTVYTATTLVAIGGTGSYTWSISEDDLLPDGLTLDSGTGVISGTPTTADDYDFTVEVEDSSDPEESDTQELSINIITAGVVLDITTTTLSGGEVGTAYSVTLVAEGGTEPYTWDVSAGDLPEGLELDSDTGVISGTPTTVGGYDFTVEVEDSSDPEESDTQELSINIIEA